MLNEKEDLFTYLHWRGDLPLCRCEPGEVDFLIFSELAYVPLEKSVFYGAHPLECLTTYVYPPNEAPDDRPLFRQRRELWQSAMRTERFAACRLLDFSSRFNEKEQIQFAAALFGYENVGIAAFRGTDATLVGWHEDFRLSFESPVPAQQKACEFIEKSAAKVDKLYLCGHSKGGNLAMYAAIHASPAVRQKIAGVYNYDGPGLDDETLLSPAMAEMESRIHSFMPESSVIGKMLGYQTNHKLIESDSNSIMQHNPFYWHLDGPAFEIAPNATLSSEITDRSLHTFLLKCSPQQRKVLVDTLFSILNASGARNTKDVAVGLMEHKSEVLAAALKVPAKDRKLIWEGLKLLFSAFGDNITKIGGSFLGKLSDSSESLLSGIGENVLYELKNLYDKK